MMTFFAVVGIVVVAALALIGLFVVLAAVFDW